MRGIIFDMDGLLFDSERLGMEVIKEAALKQGKILTDDVVIATLGATAPAGKAIYRERVPGIDVDLLYQGFAEGMTEKAKQGLIPLKKGALELLKKAKEQEIPCAVASSSPEKYVRLYLGSQHITEYFDVLVGGPAGVRSKPAPDIFLLAAEKLGVPPEECLVLEDSTNGIRAGRAAGMTVCMVPDMIPYREEYAPFVDFVAEDLTEAGERFLP
ncbi:MAG: hypothetical protein CW338_01935 [Clostridiales bacterium]|nr:hypothetical protein [Clostridiales bacterium]